MSDYSRYTDGQLAAMAAGSGRTRSGFSPSAEMSARMAREEQTRRRQAAALTEAIQLLDAAGGVGAAVRVRTIAGSHEAVVCGWDRTSGTVAVRPCDPTLAAKFNGRWMVSVTALDYGDTR